MLLAGCGSGQDAQDKPAAKPVSMLKARDVKAALADKASLPGWTQANRIVDTSIYTCKILIEDNTCSDTTASGTANFVRGPQMTTKWVRFSFNVYSFHKVSSARRLYDALPVYDPLPAGTKMPSLGDASSASSQVLNGAHKTAYIHSRVRVGNTVVWTYVTGAPKAVTGERAEMAAKLQVARVQQAYKGLKPTGRVDVP
ncbi:hypothetical protein ACIREE_11360 [Streptomyces sp. NPDC102467]|uniref:hypothetical protein n=1 Tax=Streptomyces sp. NPDC102467 TaxID=3366179 RepID=UPI003817D6EF